MAITHTNSRSRLPGTQRIFSKYADDIQNRMALVFAAHEGVLATAFFDVAQLSGYKADQLADLLHLSLKTLLRYKEENKKLNPLNSEQVLKLIALFRNGEEVFGDLAAFKRWLEKPAFGLGGHLPYDLLHTSAGIDLVQEEISRIEYGDLA